MWVLRKHLQILDIMFASKRKASKSYFSQAFLPGFCRLTVDRPFQFSVSHT